MEKLLGLRINRLRLAILALLRVPVLYILLIITTPYFRNMYIVLVELVSSIRASKCCMRPN